MWPKDAEGHFRLAEEIELADTWKAMEKLVDKGGDSIEKLQRFQRFETILDQDLATEMANKNDTRLQEISSCCCLTTAGKTRQLLLDKICIPFLPSLYVL